MELSTVIGLVLGFISIFVGMVIKGAPLSALNNPAAFLIIIGGTFSCLFIGFRLDQLKKFPILIKKTLFKNDLRPPMDIVNQFYDIALVARKEGLLALEPKLAEIEDPFMRNGVQMLVDGVNEDSVADVLEAELAFMQARHTELRSMFSQAGTYAPTLGVLGAVVGLIAALGNLNDIEKLGHSIAAAFVATILGIFTGYVLWLPFFNKLKILSEQEIHQKRMIIEGIISLQKADSPRGVANKLMVFVPMNERESLKDE